MCEKLSRGICGPLGSIFVYKERGGAALASQIPIIFIATANDEDVLEFLQAGLFVEYITTNILSFVVPIACDTENKAPLRNHAFLLWRAV
jgi:hypothetical protein